MPTIRPALASDVSAVLALWRDADAEPTHTDDEASLSKLIEYDPGSLVLAESNGRIVGSIIAAWDGWRGSIYRLVVAREERRRGLGRRLLVEAEQRLDRLGALRSQAIVVESDQQATGFWRSTQWHEQDERLRFVRG